MVYHCMYVNTRVVSLSILVLVALSNTLNI